MSDWAVFRNAPITEALIDIRCELSQGVDLSALGEYQDAIRDRFPNRRERSAWQLEFTGGQPEPVSNSVGPDGYLFESPVERKVVQARLDGFTFSKLKPYEHWGVFRDEAYALWKHYIRAARPIRVSRIAVRYINRIELPLPFDDFKEYILTIPEIAPKVNQLLSALFMRLELPYPQMDAVAVVTEALQPFNEGSPVVPLILDIDVLRECDLEPESDAVFQSLESLRELKNRIFFDSLTDKAKELFV